MRAGVASAPADGYQAVWYRFDNDTGQSISIGGPTASEGEQLQAPAVLPGDAGFLRVSVSAVDAAHPSWGKPVEVYFRRTADGWKLVGLERLPSSL